MCIVMTFVLAYSLSLSLIKLVLQVSVYLPHSSTMFGSDYLQAVTGNTHKCYQQQIFPPHLLTHKHSQWSSQHSWRVSVNDWIHLSCVRQVHDVKILPNTKERAHCIWAIASNTISKSEAISTFCCSLTYLSNTAVRPSVQRDKLSSGG